MVNKITIRNLNKAFNEKILFENVNLDIHQGERIGIVGSNGAGKTSLANILTGRLKQDGGTVSVEGSVGYLQQSTDITRHDEEFRSDSEYLKKSKELGMQHDSMENFLSGGEKLKLSLAKIWSLQPEILLLDEPTNHLDLKGIEWLIRELESFGGTVLIISHDRHFLDQVVNRVLEIDHQKVNEYAGNYSDYQEEKQRRYESELHHYQVQENERKRIKKHLASLENWSEKAHNQSTKQEGKKEFYRVKAKKMDKQVKSTRKRLQKKLEESKVDRPKEEKYINFQFQAGSGRGKRIIEARNLSMKYNRRTIFDESSFYIKKGERIGVVGPNGCGKTTLLRMFVGENNGYDGELWRSPSLTVGYLSQDVHDLHSEQTAIEAIGLTTRDEIYQARTILASMGMDRTRQTVPIEQLSLGERTKVKLVSIIMNKHDVLILDEPTNHLDLPSREQLEETLLQYTGTLIVVSHDYYFINKICDRMIIHEDLRFQRVEMRLSEFEERKKSPTDSSKASKDQKMLLENSISAIISEISLLDSGDPKIKELDEKLNELVKKKNEL